MMRMIGVVVMVGVLAATAQPRDARAAVFCKKKSGVVLVRDACKPKESPLDLVALGVQAAPAGPAGGALAGSFPNPTLADGAVTSGKLADGAVTSGKLVDGAVTLGKLGTLGSGETEIGFYSAWGSGPGYTTDVVNYRVQLAASIPGTNVHFVDIGHSFSTECPGFGQAAAGHLCVYEHNNGNRSFGNIFTPDIDFGGQGSSARGFAIYFDSPGAGGSYSYGEWAVTAP